MSTVTQQQADEFLKSFEDYVFERTDNDDVVLAAYDRFCKALTTTPFCPALLMPLVTALHAMNHRFGTLSKQVKALEAQPPSLVYKGIWAAGEVYGQGSVVTHGGSMWFAKTASVGTRPDEHGHGERCWQLCVKRGRDGKDLQ